MGRARPASVVAPAPRSSSRRMSRGTDPHMRSLRPRSGSYTQRSLPPTQAPRASQGALLLLASAAAAALVTASVLVLVWVKMTQVQAGYAIHQHHQELLQLKRERSALEVEVSSLRRPERLSRIGHRVFGLRPPAPGQVVKIDDLASLKSVSLEQVR